MAPAGMPSPLSDRGTWPRISIVTPCHNSERFLEATISSVLLQKYPNLEYIIVDGGSTDRTVDIIRKYEPWITHWRSEPDTGMYDAIQKGFAVSTGAIMGWSPSDDLYVPGAFKTVAGAMEQMPQIEWLTSLHKVTIDENGNELNRYRVPGFSRGTFMRGYHMAGEGPVARYCIAQQSTFWRRSLWERAGGFVDASYKLAGDFDLWMRFYRHAELYAVDEPIGLFRKSAGQASQGQRESYCREQEACFRKAGGWIPGRIPEWIRKHAMRTPLLRPLMRPWGGGDFRTKTVAREAQSGAWRIDENEMA